MGLITARSEVQVLPGPFPTRILAANYALARIFFCDVAVCAAGCAANQPPKELHAVPTRSAADKPTDGFSVVAYHRALRVARAGSYGRLPLAASSCNDIQFCTYATPYPLGDCRTMYRSPSPTIAKPTP
jgi:hypothetical protein